MSNFLTLPFTRFCDTTVKTTEVAQEVGHDGGKLVKGHKRHILVDTLGLLLQVIVSAANMNEKAGAHLLLAKFRLNSPAYKRFSQMGDTTVKISLPQLNRGCVAKTY